MNQGNTRRKPRLLHKAAMAVGLVVAADSLFYARTPGISAALFTLLLTGCIWYANGLRARDPAARSALLLAAMGFLALVETVSWLSGVFAVVGMISLSIPHRATWHRDGAQWLKTLSDFAIWGLGAPFKDARIFRLATRKYRRRHTGGRQVVAWVLPLGLAFVFAILFADANPIIFGWLSNLLDFVVSLIAPLRIAFWLATAYLCWPFIRARLPRRRSYAQILDQRSVSSVSRFVDALFSTEAIARSLVIFNAIFAVQTGLDATYLWGGEALPEGMTYAEYVHRGAYPLVAAALLAAAFLLIALRPGSESARRPFIRYMVYGWIAQTIILVAASAWRTELYVSAYSLTYMRVAGFVWMALVAMGLVWIVLRLIWDKSNAWLVKVNLLTAMAVLYALCFVDIGGVIAEYNVGHSRFVSNEGFLLDLDYLETIGPSALPALNRYIQAINAKQRGAAEGYRQTRTDVLEDVAYRIRAKFEATLRDWRSYTFRDYRLIKILPPIEEVESVGSERGWRIDRP